MAITEYPTRGSTKEVEGRLSTTINNVMKVIAARQEIPRGDLRALAYDSETDETFWFGVNVPAAAGRNFTVQGGGSINNLQTLLKPGSKLLVCDEHTASQLNELGHQIQATQILEIPALGNT